MKRIILMLILVSFLFSFKKETPKVLLFIQDNSLDLGYMLTKEVSIMRDLLTQSGFEVVVATIAGVELKSDQIVVKPDIKLSQVNIKEFSGLILPCMAPADTMVTMEEKSFIRQLVNDGKPVAAQTSAVILLAKAGVLKGKKYAFPKNNMISPEMFPELNNSIYNGNGVVQDQNIITSGICPMESKITGMKDGTSDLTNKLIEAIKQKT
jgi:4-methyl-5(b-hydroxyethyl)-thiazole monophosphate biosynthesis